MLPWESKSETLRNRLNMQSKADIAREYRSKYPQSPTSSLARIIYRENPSVFLKQEGARDALRYIEGKKGSRLKNYVKDSAFIMDKHRNTNPYNLPESEETNFEPYVIKGFKKVGILSDIHIPYHSIQAVTIALDYLKKEKVDAVILNGDTLDFYQLSRFDKDPRKRSFAHELESGRKFLEVIQKNLKCPIYFKLGNHEVRYEKYLMVKAPELLDISEFRLEHLLQFDKYNTKLIGDKTIIKLNHLNVIHGHEFTTGVFSPVNVARGLYMKGKVSAIQGHNHQTSSHTETDMNGKMTTTWSLGCLSELHPSYLPLNKWNHGFAVVELSDDGEGFEVFNKTIFKGKVR